MDKDARMVLDGLNTGFIANVGGILYDKNFSRIALSFSRFYRCLRELQSRGIKIERADSGGSPTWIII